MLFALTTVMSACGGGGEIATGSADAREQPTKRKIKTAPAPAPASAPAPAPAPTPIDSTISADCGLSNFSTEALQRINAYRAKGASCGAYGNFAPAPALAWNTALITAATSHALDMARNDLASHTGSDGSDGGQRMSAAGYAWSTWGENIGWGFGSVQAMVDWWMASPVHCANIMKPQFKDVGMACVKGTSTDTWSTYWTMDLAAPR